MVHNLTLVTKFPLFSLNVVKNAGKWASSFLKIWKDLFLGSLIS